MYGIRRAESQIGTPHTCCAGRSIFIKFLRKKPGPLHDDRAEIDPFPLKGRPIVLDGHHRAAPGSEETVGVVVLVRAGKQCAEDSPRSAPVARYGGCQRSSLALVMVFGTRILNHA